MNWFSAFMNSSIGKKVLMATTGLLLCLYLIIHLLGNLTLYAGETAFNQYVLTLSSIKPLVRVIEVILALIFLAHIVNALRLVIENRKAKSGGYKVNQASANSSIFSRMMGFTGSILFIFLVVHLQTIWYHFQTEHESGEFYQILMDGRIGFGNELIAILYIVAMLFLGFHLKHGFQSAFQTFGIRYNRYGKLIEIIAILFWLIIPLCFLSIPLYFGFLKGVF
jgi:succinate dehydrogenase / fumarate reductase cytochrome b subunit